MRAGRASWLGQGLGEHGALAVGPVADVFEVADRGDVDQGNHGHGLEVGPTGLAARVDRAHRDSVRKEQVESGGEDRVTHFGAGVARNVGQGVPVRIAPLQLEGHHGSVRPIRQLHVPAVLSMGRMRL